MNRLTNCFTPTPSTDRFIAAERKLNYHFATLNRLRTAFAMAGYATLDDKQEGALRAEEGGIQRAIDTMFKTA